MVNLDLHHRLIVEKEAKENLTGNNAEFWKNKYLNLLEKVNDFLENASTKS